MAKRDVELVIKAKDEATRSLNKISGALQTLETDQKDLAKSADSTGKTLGQLGAAVKKLEAQAQVGAALGTLTKSIDTTSKSLANQRNELLKTEKTVGGYAAQLQAAKDTLARLNVQQSQDFIGPRQKNSLTKLAKEVSVAETAVHKLEIAYERSQDAAARQAVAIENSETALNDLETASNRSVAALNREGDAVEKLVSRLAKLKAESTARRTYTQLVPQAQVRTGENVDQAKLRQAQEAAARAAQSLQGTSANQAQAQARAAKDAYLTAVTALSQLQTQLRNTEKPTVELGVQLGTQRARVLELANSYRALATAASDQVARERAHSQALLENAAVTRQANEVTKQSATIERAHAEAIAINNRMTRDAAKAMQVLQAEALRMNAAFDSSKIRQTTRELNLLHAEALKMNKAFDMNKANSGFAGLIANLKKLNGESRESLGLFERMRGQILAVGASYVGVFGAANLTAGLFDAQRAMDGIIAKFTVGFGGDKNKAAQEFEYVKKVANELGLDLKSLATDYAQLTVSTVGTNLEGQRTRDIFMSVAQAARVLNLSADDTSGIIKALTQIVSKGTVMSEELRGQIGERLPGALQLMANGTKVTTKELLKLMEQGKLSSDALVNFARALSEKVGPGTEDASKRAAASVERLKTSWFLLQVEVNKSGLMDAMGKSIDELVGVLRDPATIDAIVKFGKALGEVVVSVVKFIKNNPDAIISSLKAIAALLVVKVTGGLVTSIIDLVVALGKVGPALAAARGALLLFSPALAALVGPAGLIVLAAGAIALFVLNTDKVPAAVENAEKSIKGMTDAYAALNDEQKEMQQFEWALEINKAKKEMVDLKKQIDETAASGNSFASNPYGGVNTANTKILKLSLAYDALKDKVEQTQQAIDAANQADTRAAFTRFNAENAAKDQPAKDEKVYGVTEGVDKKAASIAEKIRKQNEEFETRLAMLLAKDTDNTIEGTLEAYNNAIDTKYAPAYELLVKGGKARNSEEALVIDKLVAQEKLIGAQKIQARELAKEVKARNDAEKQVNDLVALRELIQNRILFLQKQGADPTQVNELKSRINDLDTTLKQAATDAIALYQPLADLGDLDAQTTIQKLEVIRDTLGQINDRSEITKEQINQTFAGSATEAVMSFGEALGRVATEGGNLSDIFSSARDAFLSFAADFLSQIAKMIIQRAILNALENSGNSSVGGIIAGAVSAMSHHTGGTVGSGGKAVAAAPGWFTNAPKYHTGGVVGLKPDEVPAILQKGEEVLTRNDPRNRANAAGAAPQQNIKIVNAIDSVSVLNEAMGSAAGQKIILNALKANKSSIKQILT